MKERKKVREEEILKSAAGKKERKKERGKTR